MTRLLEPGEPAPWFHAKALSGNDRYAFDTVAGRWVVMLFAGPLVNAAAHQALALMRRNRDVFDDDRACFFGVSCDPADLTNGPIAQDLPGVRWLLDYDGQVSQLFGALRAVAGGARYHPHWLLLDPMLRVRSCQPLVQGERIFAELQAAVGQQPSDLTAAPVLVVPGVLPPALCEQLVAQYEAHGGIESGFMRDVQGVTVEQVDHRHKRRTDHTITAPDLLVALKGRLWRTLRPMIHRAFQVDPSRVERFIVARYDAEHGGHFRPHRDNTTKGTAHRKFACTINLNADYDGGDLRFPEFGARTYRAPLGGAVVFSCSLLHEARPVVRGTRYAFLPFFYDDHGARIREGNLDHVAPELRGYRSGLMAPSDAP